MLLPVARSTSITPLASLVTIPAMYRPCSPISAILPRRIIPELVSVGVKRPMGEIPLWRARVVLRSICIVPPVLLKVPSLRRPYSPTEAVLPKMIKPLLSTVPLFRKPTDNPFTVVFELLIVSVAELAKVSFPPVSTSTDLARAPVPLGMVGLLGRSRMTTSSVAVGTAPVLQLEAVFQSVLVQPVQRVPVAVVSRPVLVPMVNVPPLRFCTTPELVAIMLLPLAFSTMVPELFNEPDTRVIGLFESINR